MFDSFIGDFHKSEDATTAISLFPYGVECGCDSQVFQEISISSPRLRANNLSRIHTQTRLTQQCLDVSFNIVEDLDASRKIFKNLRASLIIKLHQGASDKIRVSLDASGTSGKISEH